MSSQRILDALDSIAEGVTGSDPGGKLQLVASEQEERRLFGDFLRARRAEIVPEAVGLPRVGHPRRVGGLRRDEVAQLAGISTDYYVRLEQGRVPAPSESVLCGLVQALRLDPDQERYLRDITGRSGTQRMTDPIAAPISAEIAGLLATLDLVPAVVVSRHMDVLAWNGIAARFFVDFAAVRAAERNMVLLAFFNDDFRSRFTDWPSVARTASSLLRMSAAGDPSDARLAEIVDELSSRDEDFRRWWASQQVVSSSRGPRRYVHPLVGEVELSWLTLTSSAHPNEIIVLFVPTPDGGGANALRRLVDVSLESPSQPVDGQAAPA